MHCITMLSDLLWIFSATGEKISLPKEFLLFKFKSLIAPLGRNAHLKWAIPPALLLATPVAFAAASLSASTLVNSVIALLIFGLILGLLLFLVNRAPFIPAEWKTGITYFIYFVVVLLVINWLLGFTGNSIVVIN